MHGMATTMAVRHGAPATYSFLLPAARLSATHKNNSSNSNCTTYSSTQLRSRGFGACSAAINPQRGSSPRRESAKSVHQSRASVAANEQQLTANDSSSERDASGKETGVVIIGAGLAGLAAARQCSQSGVPFLLVESSDGVGGRVRTDEHQGFLLDRGFQIFITAYPEAQAILDYDALSLQPFYAGALVRFQSSFHRVADPLRHFADGVASLANPIGSPLDKLIVGIVRLRAAVKPVSAILAAPETTILARLTAEGFSASMIDRFFRPFFGGIFFDRELQTTSRLFEFVFKCLALGSNTLPAGGIGQIPLQIASRLPASSILLNARVAQLRHDPSGAVTGVVLHDGIVLTASLGVIVAVEGPEAARLLGTKLPLTPSVSKPPRSTTCLYFATDSPPPIQDPVLFLNGNRNTGIINNMFFPSTVAPSYAPPGKTLVSVTLVGDYESVSDSELQETVREELGSWFGGETVELWTHLRTYRIALAQPDQAPPTALVKEVRVERGVYVCGDHRYSSTFDGALVSGRRAVQELLVDCKVAASQ